MKRVALFLVSSAALLLIAGCGSSGTSTTGPNGNATVNAPSKLSNRAFITNAYSGNIQVVDSQNDTTAYYTVTNNNTGISTSGGAPSSAVAISVGGSLTWSLVSPNDLETMVYSSSTNTLTFITNSTEVSSGSVNLASWAGMGVYSADSTYVYVPVPTAAVTNSRPGAVQVVATSSNTTNTSATVSYTHLTLPTILRV